MKTIRLNGSYRGKLTSERVIAPGDYAEDDPRLFGVKADYLVTNGHAVYIKSKEAVETEVNADTFPDLTPAEVHEIRARYALAVRLNAQWNAATAAKAAHDNTVTAFQGEDIYHSDSSVLTAADDLLTIPGKGVVPDIKVSKAAWAAGQGIVFPEVAPGGEVTFIPAEEVGAFPEDAIPWEAKANFYDTTEYQELYSAKEAALDEAGDDTVRHDELTAEHDARIRDAESKWRAEYSALAYPVDKRNKRRANLETTGNETLPPVDGIEQINHSPAIDKHGRPAGKSDKK